MSKTQVSGRWNVAYRAHPNSPSRRFRKKVPQSQKVLSSACVFTLDPLPSAEDRAKLPADRRTRSRFQTPHYLRRASAHILSHAPTSACRAVVRDGSRSPISLRPKRILTIALLRPAYLLSLSRSRRDNCITRLKNARVSRMLVHERECRCCHCYRRARPVTGSESSSWI